MLLNDEVGLAYGYDWHYFFVQVGILRLHNGEICELTYTEPPKKRLP